MNKDLFIEGIQYISASQAAKKIGYASDYIGQLCRDEKVPSRMIGRTWYVDFAALLAYKKTTKTKRKKPEVTKVISKGTAFVAVPLDKKVSEISLPEVQKNVPEKIENIVKSRLSEIQIPPKEVYIPVSVAPKIQFYEPKPRKSTLGLKISVASLAVLVIAIGVFGLKQLMGKPSVQVASSVLSQNASNDVPQGMVVMPDGADHAGLVAKVRNYFSDDVEVTFDKENDSGVITPVFHQGDDTEHYAFLMVPVKRTQ